MVIDTTCKHIFVLGRYLEKNHRECEESYRVSTRDIFFRFPILLDENVKTFLG